MSVKIWNAEAQECLDNLENPYGVSEFTPKDIKPLKVNYGNTWIDWDFVVPFLLGISIFILGFITGVLGTGLFLVKS